jgi:hypothetical protein
MFDRDFNATVGSKKIADFKQLNDGDGFEV